jgi:hypothetical protein
MLLTGIRVRGGAIDSVSSREFTSIMKCDKETFVQQVWGVPCIHSLNRARVRKFVVRAAHDSMHSYGRLFQVSHADRRLRRRNQCWCLGRGTSQPADWRAAGATPTALPAAMTAGTLCPEQDYCRGSAPERSVLPPSPDYSAAPRVFDRNTLSTSPSMGCDMDMG